MRDMDPAPRIGLLRGRTKVKYAREDLRREDGNLRVHVAAREHGEVQTLSSVDVLVDRGEGCRPFLGGLDGELKLVQLALEAGKHV